MNLLSSNPLFTEVEDSIFVYFIYGFELGE